jgi:PEP-CTERM motif
MRAIFTLGALAAAGLAAAQPAIAIDTIWGGGGSNDSVSWGQLGPTDTVVPSGTAATSVNGLVLILTDSVGSMERRDQGNGWDGSFGLGEQLLWNEGDGTITITFGTPVSAAGAQIQSDSFGDFIARITLNDGSFFTIGGTSAPTGADTNPFIGAISDSANIASISFSMPTNGPSFAISSLLLIDGPSVPEPATWALMLLGFGTMGLAIRRGRKLKALEALA